MWHILNLIKTQLSYILLNIKLELNCEQMT